MQTKRRKSTYIYIAGKRFSIKIYKNGKKKGSKANFSWRAEGGQYEGYKYVGQLSTHKEI